MRITHLSPSWGLLLTLVLCLSLAVIPASYAADETITLILKGVSFSTIVDNLQKQSGQTIVLRPEVDPKMVTDVNIADLPLAQALSTITSQLGLVSWTENDVVYIGKQPAAHPQTPAPAPDLSTPTLSNPPVNTTEASAVAWPSEGLVQPATPREDRQPVIRRIELKHSAARDITYMLGMPSLGPPPSASMQKKLRNRAYSILNNRRQNIHADEGESYTSPALTSPWYSNLGRGSTDGNQFPPPAGPGPGVGPAPGPGVPGAPGTTGTTGGGGLMRFMPQRVRDIVGLIGLNALLVRAEALPDDPDNSAANADLDRLEQLIAILDQPVKQVVVEVMFVKMEVKDAMSLGSSWELSGAPVSIISQNAGGEGNFAIRYIKGNLKVALSTLITTSRAKVVNAPRVIVQNGGMASITMTDSIPFIIINEEQDVFGRTIETPDIEMQEFEQGLDVNNVIIHPDNTVTLDVTPILDAPGATVGIPSGSGSGSVSGSTSADVMTIVRVKDGETIMMGGFVSKNEFDGGTRAPLLSNLPIIGPLLFRSVSKNTNNTETLVFITPFIMKDDITDYGGMQTLPPLF
ncbi:MAG: type II secretion system protein GspD [Armatimonadota bacterium]